MRTIPFILVALSGALIGAAFLGYPVALRLLAGLRGSPLPAGPRAGWPFVSVLLVVRNAETAVRHALHNLVSQAYPADRRQILVVSDASSDFTDAVVRTFAHRGVQLLRMMRPMGAAAAERKAWPYLFGDIIVVVDVAAQPRPWTLAALVAPFTDPTVGLAFGREVAAAEGAGVLAHRKESPYRRYESWLRDLETRVFGTVSARGSLYAVRDEVYFDDVPGGRSRDFGLALLARERGYRAVAVPEAECVVTRAPSLHGDYARKVRALARDVATLLAKPYLLDPFRYGVFAWMLLGHKLSRWLVPWAALAGLVGLVLLAPSEPWARLVLAGLGAAGVFAWAGWRFEGRVRLTRVLALPGRLAAATVAIAHASIRAVLAMPDFTYEPRLRPMFAGAQRRGPGL